MNIMKKTNVSDDKKYNLFYLLFRSVKDKFSIAPKYATIQVISMFIQAITAAVNTYFITRLINSAQLFINKQTDHMTLITYGVAIVLLFILNEFASSIFMGSMTKVDSLVLFHLNVKLSKKCAKIPLIAYEDSSNINSLNRAHQCLQWARLSDLSLSFFNIISELLRVLSIMFILGAYNIWLVPISVVSVLPFLIIRIIRGNEFYQLRWYQSKKERKRNYFFGLFNNKVAMKEIRMMQIEDYIQKKWEIVRDEVNDDIWNFRKKDTLSLLVCDFLRILGYLASIVFSVLLTLNGALSIGVLAACIVAFSQFQTASKYFFINVGRIPECALFTKDYYYFMDQPDASNGHEPLKSKNIHLRDVCFSYPNTTDKAIKNLNLDIYDGETVVVLGENGHGKTTLINLILGFYKCDSGQVMYGKQNISDIDLNKLYEITSLVTQNFIKYNLSLRENIAISNYNNMHDNEKINDLIEQMDLSKLFFDDGLDTKLGPEFGGKELSHGQWQKLALARGTFKDSSIIILDEPTAALDPIIEAEILKKFIDMTKDKTAIIVSHRVGLCKEADKIIVMKNGTAIECGDHSSLMRLNGEYHRLYTMQSKWYV